MKGNGREELLTVHHHIMNVREKPIPLKIIKRIKSQNHLL